MVVLATKVYVLGEGRRRAMDSLESLVGNELGELDVAFTVGLRDDEFPSVTVTGEDAPVARNLLEARMGRDHPSPGSRRNIRRNARILGRRRVRPRRRRGRPNPRR